MERIQSLRAPACKAAIDPATRLWTALPAIALVLLTATDAHAWTETQVTTASAEVTVEPDGQLRVVLTAELKVLGGWVTDFEIDGLPSDARLDPELPLSLASADGEKTFVPAVAGPTAGKISLHFNNRWQAPRRSLHQLRVAFLSRQALASAVRPDRDHVRMTFQLPAWENGLANVSVKVHAPLGTVAVPTDDLVTTSTAHGPERTQLLYHRHQLPRTVPLDVVFDVPSSAFVGAGVPTAGPVLHSLRAPFKPSPRSLPLLFLGLLLAACKLVVNGSRHRGTDTTRRFLLPGPTSAVRLTLIGLAGVAGAFSARETPCAAVAAVLVATTLVLERRAVQTTDGAPTTPFNATHHDISALRLRALLERFDASAMLDVSTPAGALVAACIALLTLAVARHFPSSSALTLTFALMASAVFLSGTRKLQPQSVAEQARRLLGVLPQLAKVHPDLLLFRSGLGQPVKEVRLRLRITAPGLYGANLVVGEMPWLDRHLQPLCWLIVVEAGSQADRNVRAAFPGTTPVAHRADNRLAYLAVAHHIADEAKCLQRWLAPHSNHQTAQAA